MSAGTIQLLHRIAVDWTADAFSLHGRDAGREHNAAAAFRARRRHDRGRARGQGAAASLPGRLHRHHEPRVLRGWQSWIGGAGRASGSRP